MRVDRTPKRVKPPRSHAVPNRNRGWCADFGECSEQAADAALDAANKLVDVLEQQGKVAAVKVSTLGWGFTLEEGTWGWRNQPGGGETSLRVEKPAWGHVARPGTVQVCVPIGPKQGKVTAVKGRAFVTCGGPVVVSSQLMHEG